EEPGGNSVRAGGVLKHTLRLTHSGWGAKKGAALGQRRLPSGKNTTVFGGRLRVPRISFTADLLLLERKIPSALAKPAATTNCLGHNQTFPRSVSFQVAIARACCNLKFVRPMLEQRTCHVGSSFFKLAAGFTGVPGV